MHQRAEKSQPRQNSHDSYDENINGAWCINHCRARIRILTVYCMFLTKRAYYYKSDVRKTGLIEFVKSQYQEMLGYKTQLVALEQRAARYGQEGQPRDIEKIKEIDDMSARLTQKINASFQEISAKVSEKVPGEKVANSFEITDDEISALLSDDLDEPRYW